MLDLLLLVHCETFTEVNDLLQLVDHLIGENFDAAVCHIIDISRFGPALPIDDRSDGEEPIDELFALLEVREPLVDLIFLVGAEQQDGLVVEVDLDRRANLVLSHLYSCGRPPNANYLTHFEDLSVLQLRLAVIARLLEDGQLALNRVHHGEPQGRLARLFLRQELEGVELANHRGNKFDPRLLKLLNKLYSLQGERALRPRTLRQEAVHALQGDFGVRPAVQAKRVDHLMCARVLLFIQVAIRLVNLLDDLVEHSAAVTLGIVFFVVGEAHRQVVVFLGLILAVEQKLVVLIDQGDDALVCGDIPR